MDRLQLKRCQWLRVGPEEITQTTRVQAYLHPLSNSYSQKRSFRSSTSDDLIVPAVRLTSVGCRAFPVATAHIWSTLPLQVTSASSLTVFNRLQVMCPKGHCPKCSCALCRFRNLTLNLTPNSNPNPNHNPSPNPMPIRFGQDPSYK